MRNLLMGMLVGAIAGALYAPETGRRTRALMRDKALKYGHRTAEYVDKKSRHFRNILQGYGAKIRHLRGNTDSGVEERSA